MILAIVFIIYIFALVFVGYYAYKKTNSSEDFMIAGKDTHPFIMAMSYGATFISTAAIVGFGGVASQYGMSVEDVKKALENRLDALASDILMRKVSDFLKKENNI